MRVFDTYSVSIILLFFTVPIAFGEEADSSKLSDREELWESTQSRELNDWLTLLAIAEIEFGQERQIPYQGKHIKTDELSSTLEIELGLHLSEQANAEVVFEAGDDKNDIDIDKAILQFELGESDIEVGKMNLPFGDYTSNFISDSVTNFAETKAFGLALNHELNDSMNLSLFTYNGDVKKIGRRSIDWGISAEYSANDSLKFGVGFISDLADAEDIGLEANNYEKRVSGFNLSAQYEFGKSLINAEYLAALDSFHEFDDDRNKAKAWNIELAYYPTNKTKWALRYAGSKELEDQPKRQYGVSGTWLINKKVSLNLEYLRNNYKTGLAEDDEERFLHKSNGLVGSLTVAF